MPSTLPELDAMGADTVSAPEFRQRNIAFRKFSGDALELLQQHFLGRQWPALCGCPGSQLAFAGTGPEICTRLFLGYFLRYATHLHLPFYGVPGKMQAHTGVAADVPALLALVIGEKDK